MEPTTLSAIAFAAILSVTQDSKWVSGEDRPRLEKVAEVMAKTVLDKGCIVKEQDCEKSSVLALVAIDFHESGFAADVQDCSRCVIGGQWCDHGRAVTAYQMQRNIWLEHGRAEVCKDFSLATSLAWDALSKPKGTWKNKFRTYAGRTASGLELYKQHQTLLFLDKKKTGSLWLARRRSSPPLLSKRVRVLTRQRKRPHPRKRSYTVFYGTSSPAYHDPHSGDSQSP